MSARAIALRQADRRLRKKLLAREAAALAHEAWLEEYEAEEFRQHCEVCESCREAAQEASKPVHAMRVH